MRIWPFKGTRPVEGFCPTEDEMNEETRLAEEQTGCTCGFFRGARANHADGCPAIATAQEVYVGQGFTGIAPARRGYGAEPSLFRGPQRVSKGGSLR